MTEEQRQQITSEEFADILIEYNRYENVLQNFSDYTVNIVNDNLAVAHLPNSLITDISIVELGYAVIPSLFGLISEVSLEASGITRTRSNPNLDLRGNGIMIGIVDTGIDYTNPLFQYGDGTSKILSLWDQTIESENYPDGIFYGTEYSREQINEALANPDPYSIVPSRDDNGHGTMLAGIAAGNEDPEHGFSGVATDSELVIVKLREAKTFARNFFLIPEGVPCYQENHILQGIQYLINVAKIVSKPLVICIAVGTSQGAHDGRGILSGWVSNVAEWDGIGVVIAAGNEGSNRRHFSGMISKDTSFENVELNVGPNVKGFSMELWGDTPTTFSIDIQSPSGEYIPRIELRLDERREVTFIFELTVIRIDFQMIESQSGLQLILMRFINPTEGIWSFRVYGRGGNQDKRFNMWLPMGDFITQETYFIQSDPNMTILSLGNGEVPITTTAYDIVDNSLYRNASRGYTLTGVVKPEIAAPGVNMLSPSRDGGFVDVTGTSGAAAHTAGVVAMLFEWGIVRGNYDNMSTMDAKVFMIRGAKRNLDIIYPNREWGYGILDVYNIFESLRRIGE